jgi:hypothetical protein
VAGTPDDRHSVVITKQFMYRGATRTFSNRYHFEGALPTDAAAWAAFVAAIVAVEKTIYSAGVEIIGATGYDSSSASPTNPHGDAVFTETLSVAGTGNFTSTGFQAPGDCAAYVRYSTPARSTKNHPVYLANYYHDVWHVLGDPDTIDPTQKTALQVYAADWLTGFTCDGTPRERCGPHGAVATNRKVDDHVRHRDFPA